MVRAEGALYLGKARAMRRGRGLERETEGKGLLGLDWYARNEWMVSGQYCHVYGSKGGNGGLASLRVRKWLMNHTMELSSFAYIDLCHGGWFERLSAEYALTDDVKVSVGLDWLRGRKGMFRRYKDNSEVWTKVAFFF